MRGIVAAGLVVAVMAFAGCTDEPEPRFQEPSDTPSASDPTSSAAAEPEPWEEKSKAGAEAFVQHWIETFNESIVSGETAGLATLSANGCVSCRNVILRTQKIYRRGGFNETKGWRVTQLALTPGQPLAQPTVALRVVRSAERYQESDEGPVLRNPASTATYKAELRWRDAQWLMDELVLFG